MTMRELPAGSPFAGDDGSPDPALTAVLKAWQQGAAQAADVVGTLAHARVLVPVLPHARAGGAATAEGAGEQVGCHDATAGVVAVAGPDGRTALPVFSGVAALTAWRPQARPVPATTPRAAASALAEGWPVLVVDPAGPVRFVLGRPAVQALAAGTPWRPAVTAGQVDAEVVAAVRTALRDVLGVVGARPEPGGRTEIAVRLALVAGLDRPALARVVDRADAALTADPVLAARVDSIELLLTRA